MKIIKYEKKSNNEYKIYLDNSDYILINEEVILKYNLLYKKELDNSFLEKILLENNYYRLYNKCFKYILVRLRSKKEIETYLKKKDVADKTINKIINELIQNKLLDDAIFAKAFITDKLKFSSMGPYKIILELKKVGVEDSIINNQINLIDIDILKEKLNKLISKSLNSNKKQSGLALKNKIYHKLLSLGYDSSLILEMLSNYNFD